MLRFFRIIGDVALAPFSWLPPLAALLAFSVACGVLFLLAFKGLSSRGRLKRVKELMSATLHEMRLFSSSPLLVLQAQGRAVWLTLRYLVLALPALLVLFPPMGLRVARASTWYEFRPLRQGEQALVTVTLDPKAPQGQVQAEAVSGGIEVVGPVVTVRSLGQGFFQVKGREPRHHDLKITLGGRSVTKTVQVATGGPVSWARTKGGQWEGLLGHEDSIAADAPFSSVVVDYPQWQRSWWGMPWWLLFFIVTLVAAFALRRKLGVVF